MENMKKGEISWVKIILALIFFWPLGILLIYFKLSHNGSKFKTTTTILRGLAAFCYFGTACLILTIPETNSSEIGSTIFGIFLFLFGGIVSTFFARKNIKKQKYYKKYVDYLSIRRNVSLGELSDKMEKNVETVIEDIAKIFEYQMLQGYINEENEIIIMSNNQYNYATLEKKQVLTIKCKNCGATNKFVVGKENHCEYCDSLLINN